MSLVPPPNFTANSELFQNSAYVGINLQDILYGVELALYFETMYVLLIRRERKRHAIFYAIFSSAMILLITVWIIAEAHFGEVLWVLSRTLSGGSSLRARIWFFGCGTLAIIVLQLMTDALMIYRCWIIWDNRLVIVVSSVLWVATLTLGILTAWSSRTQEENFILGVASKFALVYYAATVFLNAFLTGAICYRMLQHGRMVREHLGYEYATVYFWVATLIIESMLPYTLAGIVFLALFGMGSPTFMPSLSVYTMLMCLSSQMLIFRVSTRKVWEKGMGKPADSTIKFGSLRPDSQCSDVV